LRYQVSPSPRVFSYWGLSPPPLFPFPPDRVRKIFLFPPPLLPFFPPDRVRVISPLPVQSTGAAGFFSPARGAGVSFLKRGPFEKSYMSGSSFATLFEADLFPCKANTPPEHVYLVFFFFRDQKMTRAPPVRQPFSGTLLLSPLPGVLSSPSRCPLFVFFFFFFPFLGPSPLLFFFIPLPFPHKSTLSFGQGSRSTFPIFSSTTNLFLARLFFLAPSKRLVFFGPGDPWLGADSPPTAALFPICGLPMPERSRFLFSAR